MVSCRFPHCTKPEPSIIYLLFNNVAQLVQSRLCLLHQDKLLFVRNTSTAGQRTMSSLIWELTSQPSVLPVMVTCQIWSYWKWNKLRFPCCSVVSVYYQYVASCCVVKNFDLRSLVKSNYNCCLQFAHWNRHWVHALPVATFKFLGIYNPSFGSWDPV